MQPLDAVLPSTNITLPFFINPLTHLFKQRLSATFEGSAKASIIAASAGLAVYGSIMIYFSLQDRRKPKSIDRDPCFHLWLEKLPDLKKRIEALKIFSFAHSKNIQPLNREWNDIEKLLIDPIENREKIVQLAKSLHAKLESHTLSELENPLPNR